ncbi:MAG: hypothetical protein QN209_12095, partial [Armatimonadota bacterium]|nr:hypothetical protein [Armatimonadota bacterium]
TCRSGRIAFLSRIGEGNWYLQVMNPDGSGRTRLTSGDILYRPGVITRAGGPASRERRHQPAARPVSGRAVACVSGQPG